MLSEILDLSKIESGTIELVQERFRPSSTLDAIIEIHRSKARQQTVALLFEKSENTEREFLGDPTRTKQIASNLISNAIKFSEGGKIAVQADIVYEDATSPSLFLQVTDTGIGIEPDKIEKIFHPFQQADPSTTRIYGGTGLGLSIVKQLVEIMDGRVEVESTVGEGTTFKVWINLTAIDVPSKATEPAFSECAQ